VAQVELLGPGGGESDGDDEDDDGRRRRLTHGSDATGAAAALSSRPNSRGRSRTASQVIRCWRKRSCAGGACVPASCIGDSVPPNF